MKCAHCGKHTPAYNAPAPHFGQPVCGHCKRVNWLTREDDMMTMRAALDVCERQAGQDAEFWRRLAGSVRKGLTMLQ